MRRRWTIHTEQDIMAAVTRFCRLASWCAVLFVALACILAFASTGVLALYYGLLLGALVALSMGILGAMAEERISRALLRYLLAMCVQW